MIAIPRADVDTINGTPLPPPVGAGSVAPSAHVVDLTGAPQTVPGPSGQPAVLKFWATWCPHCRADVPLMKTIASRYAGRVRVLTFSVDQNLKKLRDFVDKEQLSYPVVPVYEPSASSEQAALPDRYELQGIPGYYLIDGSGKITETFSGSLTEGKVDLEEKLKRLLPPEPPPPASSSKH